MHLCECVPSRDLNTCSCSERIYIYITYNYIYICVCVCAYIYMYVYVCSILFYTHCAFSLHCISYTSTTYSTPRKKSLEIFSSKRELYLPDMSSVFSKPCGLLLISPSGSHRAADLHAASAALYLENSWV